MDDAEAELFLRKIEPAASLTRASMDIIVDRMSVKAAALFANPDEVERVGGDILKDIEAMEQAAKEGELIGLRTLNPRLKTQNTPFL